MNEDSPKIVSLETSLELSEFPSEIDFPSEEQPRADRDASSTPLSLASAEPAAPAASLSDDEAPVRPATSVSAAPAASATEPDFKVRSDDAADERGRVNTHGRPATITEFPVRPQTPAAVALTSFSPGPGTLVDLIERRGGFDWREAVAVIHQICLYLKEHAQHPPILLDPRTIQITEKGEVQLLSGQTSSDPVVIQVGRLMRTMLMGKEAPPELRLLLSQATFELPIFESIEDVDRALAQLNKLDEPGPAGLALLRAVAAPPPPPTPENDYANRPPPIRSILPAQRTGARRSRGRSRFASLFGSYASHLGVIFAAIAVIGGLLLVRPAFLFPKDAPSTATAQAAPLEVASPGSTASAPTAAVPAAPAPKHLPTPTHARQPSARTLDRAGIVIATPLAGNAASGEAAPPASSSPHATATAGLVRTPPGAAPSPSALPPASSRDTERRPALLLKQIQAAAESMAFDALVMSHPLFEPKSGELTPEALTAFRASQRLQLPMIAQRDYDRAKAALDGGDADRALDLAREAMTIIDRRRGDSPPQLRDQTQALIDKASAAVALQNEIVYTDVDVDVVPPRQLTRQMPLTGPIGVPPNRVGWLEMIIGRDGSVENVKLHTPLNRHHERMIVSPAKAWRYRPATRNGRPVRYRIMVKVNLPESGTDF